MDHFYPNPTWRGITRTNKVDRCSYPCRCKTPRMNGGFSAAWPQVLVYPFFLCLSTRAWCDLFDPRRLETPHRQPWGSLTALRQCSAGAQRRSPTDEVLPMHHFDDNPINQSIILAWTLRFNDVLDADKLHDGLARLLEIGDCRKLGGRIRKGPNGKLEIHVPAEFTPDRPAVRFTKESFGVSFAEHPLASQMPNATSDIHIHGSPERFREFIGSADTTPGSIDHYLHSDTPQLGLHVVAFLDATLISLNWPHTMTDGLGRLALIKNWCKVLAGKEDQVAPLMGTREDPMATVGAGPLHEKEEPYALKDKNLSGLSMVNFVAHFIWDKFWVPEHELKVVFLPGKAMAVLRKQAANDLSTTNANGQDTSASNGTVAPATSFVSDGDILTAWLTQITFRASGPSSRPPSPSATSTSCAAASQTSSTRPPPT
ncbi:hypothetical protein FJTKL_01375 [Diaporthe vaccinii]|uniref:BCL5p n=1 Tax=Diaporthe vaccinii TaxID=105482 RepID=A0ABR4E0Z0_9PEZI